MSNPPLPDVERLLLGPGPSPVSPRIMRAMAAPVLSHLDPDMLRIMDDLRARLGRVFQAAPDGYSLAVSGTGSAGMEMAVANMVREGTHVLVVLQPGKEEVYLPLTDPSVPDPERPLREALDRLRIEYLDLTPGFRQRAAAGARLFFEVDGHPNAAGYALIALHWGRNERLLPPIPAKRALGNMRNIFVFCGICGYAFIPIKMIWPAWRFQDAVGRATALIVLFRHSGLDPGRFLPSFIMPSAHWTSIGLALLVVTLVGGYALSRGTGTIAPHGAWPTGVGAAALGVAGLVALAWLTPSASYPANLGAGQGGSNFWGILPVSTGNVP